eukprot:CAMPEP_0206207924 /NCGR_PEP_ID=MMETSP0166-20121206/15891_1 /ASSEMBLY_ACC=CAM_ASM_000260 /TAXON_ID=95228 /ORGANISM="Vannella robusta, Strain DIVA3 518/3/11/1/6" /LENGTH=172 /DNA_ID=CAMNT_0053628799 /DNA_START=798 /DNA_END=1316 /DNA_ORIENTATION=-
MSFKRFDTSESSFTGTKVSDETFTIFVRTLTGSARPLTVYSDYTINEVKEQIFEFFGIHMDAQTLLFRAKILQDTNNLMDYNIGKESIITLVTKNEKKESVQKKNKPTKKEEPQPQVYSLEEENTSPLNRILISTFMFAQLKSKSKTIALDPTILVLTTIKDFAISVAEFLL